MPAGAKVIAVFVVALGAIASGYFFLIPPEPVTPPGSGPVSAGAGPADRDVDPAGTPRRALREGGVLLTSPSDPSHTSPRAEDPGAPGSGASSETASEPLRDRMARAAVPGALSGSKGDVEPAAPIELAGPPEIARDPADASPDAAPSLAGIASAFRDGAGTVPSDPDASAGESAGAAAVAPTPEPEEPAESPAAVVHHVKGGETLASIAASWFGDPGKWPLIAEANPGLDPHHLQIGQRLNLPEKERGLQDDGPRRDAGVTRQYTVRGGDTLTQIAIRLYGDPARWRDLYEANRDAIGESPNNLVVGTRLVVPRPG